MATLKRELKQGKPFRSRGQEPVLAILRTADVVKSRLLIHFKKHNLTLGHYNILRILRGALNRGDTVGLPTLEIVNRMIERGSPGITRLLDGLEHNALVERERSDDDRRVVFCRITQTGLACLEQLDARVDEVDEYCVRNLSKQDCTLLVSLLEHVRDEEQVHAKSSMDKK